MDASVVATRDDFADFLQAVLQDFQASGEEWENGTLPRFLDGLAAVSWAHSAEERSTEDATWRLFAELIASATGYE